MRGAGNFSLALVFVAANALIAVIGYLVPVGEIERVVLSQDVAG